jgi:hypothetical protein
LLGGDKDPIVPLNEINPEIFPAVSQVILKGVELRQDQRFSSAAEMQKALRRAFKQEKADELGDVTINMGAEVLVAAPQTNPSEMATRAQPPSTLEESTENGSPVTVKLPKQSEIKTEVLSSPREAPGEMETPVAVPPAENLSRAAVAATGVNPAPAPPAHVNIPKAPPVKRSSKSGLIIIALVGLLLLGGAAVGGGWFYYSKYSAAQKPTPVPTPAPASPSPSPTVEVVVESNQNTNPNSNSNAAVVGSSSNADRAPRTTTAPGSVPPRQPATGKDPGSVPQPPPSRSTPKAKPKDDRTVILQ